MNNELPRNHVPCTNFEQIEPHGAMPGYLATTLAPFHEL